MSENTTTGGFIINQEFGKEPVGRSCMFKFKFWPKLVERVTDLCMNAYELGFKKGKEELKMDAAIDKMPNLEDDNELSNSNKLWIMKIYNYLFPGGENIKGSINSKLENIHGFIKRPPMEKKLNVDAGPKAIGDYKKKFTDQFCSKLDNYDEFFLKKDIQYSDIEVFLNALIVNLSEKKKLHDNAEMYNLNEAVRGFAEQDFGLMSRIDIAEGVKNIAIAHAEAELQKVYKLSDEEYKKVQDKIDYLVNYDKPGYNYKVGIDPASEDKKPKEDNWIHRAENMKCATCMWYVPKGDGKIGRCRHCAPTIKGWPAMFPTDWCGQHKLDEDKL